MSWLEIQSVRYIKFQRELYWIDYLSYVCAKLHAVQAHLSLVRLEQVFLMRSLGEISISHESFTPCAAKLLTNGNQVHCPQMSERFLYRIIKEKIDIV
jgi:hypothetical protein